MDAAKRQQILLGRAETMADRWIQPSARIHQLSQQHQAGLNVLEACGRSCQTLLERLIEGRRISVRRVPIFHLDRRFQHSLTSSPRHIYQVLRQDLVEKAMNLFSYLLRKLRDLALQGFMWELFTVNDNVYHLRNRQPLDFTNPFAVEEDWTLIVKFIRLKSEIEPVCPEWVQALLDAIDGELEPFFQIIHGNAMNGTPHGRAWALNFQGIILAFWTEEDIEQEQRELALKKEKAARDAEGLAELKEEVTAMKEKFRLFQEENKRQTRLEWMVKAAEWTTSILRSLFFR